MSGIVKMYGDAIKETQKLRLQLEIAEKKLNLYRSITESFHNHPQMETEQKLDDTEHTHIVVDTDTYYALRAIDWEKENV
jgi:hypothetical protein